MSKQSRLQFDHSFTPSPLKEINQQLSEILAKDDVDEARLLLLIEQRDRIVKEHLDSLEEDVIQQFAEAELEVNQRLEAVSKKLLSDSLGNLSGLIRGRKAVEKYK